MVECQPVMIMRMRKKPNLIPRMERCSAILVKEPQNKKGKWLEGTDFTKLYLELGCGKGRFTVDTAKSEPDALIAAIERVPDAMIIGMERAMQQDVKNVLFMDMDVSLLPDVFEEGEADRIYINFCDPWPKKRNAKRRLTSPGFLSIYRKVLKPGGEIHFKTDNLPLFEYSLECFKENGFDLKDVTNDLHKDGMCGIITDYEEKFCAQGIKINRCVAVPKNSEKEA